MEGATETFGATEEVRTDLLSANFAVAFAKRESIWEFHFIL